MPAKLHASRTGRSCVQPCVTANAKAACYAGDKPDRVEAVAINGQRGYRAI